MVNILNRHTNNKLKYYQNSFTNNRQIINLCLKSIVKTNEFDLIEFGNYYSDQLEYKSYELKAFILYKTKDSNQRLTNISSQFTLESNLNNFKASSANFYESIENIRSKTPKDFTRQKNIRPVMLWIDNNNSSSINKETIINRNIKLSICDRLGKNIYDFLIDWNNQKVQLTIGEEKLNNFYRIYFPYINESETGKPIEILIIEDSILFNDTRIEIYENETQIFFNSMPPFDENGNSMNFNYFAKTDEELQSLVNANTIWEDRERIIIKTNSKNKIEKIVSYLKSYNVNK